MTPLKDFDTLADAKAYSVTQPRLIHRDSMNSLLASAGLYVGFKAIAEDNTNPFQNLIAAFLDSTEYNFMIGNETGDRQIAALDTIISSGGELGAALAAMRPVILAMANPSIQPYANTTVHDFAVAKDTINRVQKVEANGWLKITTTANCESHKPQIYVDILGVRQRINGFGTVDKAGDYLVKVERGYDVYYVDNAYGVIG